MTGLTQQQTMILKLSAFNQRDGVGSAIRLQGSMWASAFALVRRGLATIERGARTHSTVRATAAGLAQVPKPEDPTPSRRRPCR